MKRKSSLLLQVFSLFLSGILPASASESRPLVEWEFQKLGPGSRSEAAKVTLPHSWNVQDSTRKDYYRGPAIYECELGPGTAFGGKRVFLRCEAVSTVAEIVLDGQAVGEHRGGFTAFGFELTRFLSPAGPNRLEVRASNAWRADVIPLGMDFSIAGGMYRPASLVLCDSVCLNPVVDGTHGVVLQYGQASKERAGAIVTATVSNGGAAPAPVTVRCRFLEADGRLAAEAVGEAQAAPGDTRISLDLSIVAPHLWNGVRDPYLYTAEVSLLVAGRPVDTLRFPAGFRDLRFDPEKGCILNGEPLRLNGVNRHQDIEGHGWAMTEDEHRNDAAMIAELGANAVRLAHYPHSQAFLDECDRLGLLVWAEIPLVDSVGFPSKHPGLEDNVERQLREMIRQQGQHPAIFCWSLFNELGMAKTVDYVPTVRRLNRVAHEEDPSRPTVGATFHPDPRLCRITDLMAFNNYPGWYYDTPADMGKFVEQYAKAAPGKPWGASEYGAGASVKHHDLNIAKKPPSSGHWHPEEWQCRVHEANYATLRESRLWGTFLWNMFDFASIGKNEGDRDGINDKGLVTRDRQIRKDAFYFYQANWSNRPVLHLNSRRASIVKEAMVPIRLYSNLGDLRVRLNGEDLGTPELYAPMSYCTKPVPLKPGKNKVEASGKTKVGETVTDSLEWELVP